MHVCIQKVKSDCYMQNSVKNFPSGAFDAHDKGVQVTIEHQSRKNEKKKIKSPYILVPLSQLSWIYRKANSISSVRRGNHMQVGEE